MSLFNLFKKKRSPEKNAEIAKKKISDYIFDIIQSEQGVRVEDAICLSATIVAERCIQAAGDYNIYDHELTPGFRVFSDKINFLLTGDDPDKNWENLSPESVFGRIVKNLKDDYSIDSYPVLTEIFENFANNVGKESDWGKIPYTIPEENHPLYLPLQIGFESRNQIDKLLSNSMIEIPQQLNLVTDVLSSILIQTRAAIDPSIALTLSIELINGMSKTAPMTLKNFNSVKDGLSN